MFHSYFDKKRKDRVIKVEKICRKKEERMA